MANEGSGWIWDLAGLGLGLVDVYRTGRAASEAQDTLSQYSAQDAQAYGDFSQRAGEFWELQKLNTGQVNEARDALSRLAETVAQTASDPQSQKLYGEALSIYDSVLKGAKWSQLFPTALDDMTRARDWDVRKVRDELDQTKQFINENIPAGSGAYARMLAQAAIENANKVGETRRKWDTEIASWDRDRTKELVLKAMEVAQTAKTDTRAGLMAAGQLIQNMPQYQTTLPSYTQQGGRQWDVAMEAVKGAGASRQALGRYIGTLGAEPKESELDKLLEVMYLRDKQKTEPASAPTPTSETGLIYDSVGK